MRSMLVLLHANEGMLAETYSNRFNGSPNEEERRTHHDSASRALLSTPSTVTSPPFPVRKSLDTRSRQAKRGTAKVESKLLGE